MKRAMRDTIINVSVAWILFSIAYSNRDIRSYFMHKEIVDTFIDPVHDQELPKFNKVHTCFAGFFSLQKLADYLSELIKLIK